MQDKTILLIIGGGIAAYKSLELIRLLKKRGAKVRVILTPGGAQFVTPLSVSTLAGEKAFSDLFDLDDESEIGHIKLARSADLVVVASATADLMAKMAGGQANDLATTCLLASHAPKLIAPTMNPVMYEALATKRNLAQLKEDGVYFAGPASGDMACGEEGVGRMLEPEQIVARIKTLFDKQQERPLKGRHVLVTAGPTHEPIDPVRYIANRSSGKQGYALAQAACDAGARVTLVSGPTGLATPKGVQVLKVQTAKEMLAAVKKVLPADIALCAAAVADWRVAKDASQKIKKKGEALPPLELVENPDILKILSKKSARRPELVIGFAAETQNLIKNARAKRKAKGCDWIIANDVSEKADVFGGDKNEVVVINKKGVDEWPRLGKIEVARRLMAEIAKTLSKSKQIVE